MGVDEGPILPVSQGPRSEWRSGGRVIGYRVWELRCQQKTLNDGLYQVQRSP